VSRDYAKAVSDKQIEKTKAALEANGFNVKVVADLPAAKKEVLGMIPRGADVFTGTSETLRLAGIDEELNESGHYDSARKRFMPLMQEGKAIEAKQIGSASDYAVGSVHAVTENGQVLIASASGSQLPNYVYGANRLIWVVGSQKLVADLDEGIDRIETYTLPLEDVRSEIAYGVGSIISKLVIYRKERNPERVTIVLVKEAVGY
jgi:hypothetical protein